MLLLLLLHQQMQPMHCRGRVKRRRRRLPVQRGSGGLRASRVLRVLRPSHILRVLRASSSSSRVVVVLRGVAGAGGQRQYALAGASSGGGGESLREASQLLPRLACASCGIQRQPPSPALGEYVNEKRLRYVIQISQIKEVIVRRDLLLIRLRLPGIAPIRMNAFETEEDAKAFVDFVNGAVAKRIASAEQASSD